MHRRKVVISTCIGIVGFAGCLGSENEDDDGATEGSEMDTEPSASGNSDGDTQGPDEADIVVEYTPGDKIDWDDALEEVPEEADGHHYRADWHWAVGDVEVVKGEFDVTDVLNHSGIGNGPGAGAVVVTSDPDEATFTGRARGEHRLDEEYIVGPGDTFRVYSPLFEHAEDTYEDTKKWSVGGLQDKYEPEQFQVIDLGVEGDE